MSEEFLAWKKLTGNNFIARTMRVHGLTPDAVRRLSDEELLQMRNMGPARLQELRKALATPPPSQAR
jgi:hypothetical protein